MNSVYKVRHKASGLYYNGRGDWNCLVPDPDGKWYKTKNTYITYLQSYNKQTITIDTHSRLYKNNHDIFEKCLVQGVCSLNEGWGTLEFKVTADDFELVQFDVLLANPRIIKD